MVNAFLPSLYSYSFSMFCFVLFVLFGWNEWHEIQCITTFFFYQNCSIEIWKKWSEMKIRRVPIENSLHKNVKLCHKFAGMVCLPMCVCAYMYACEYHKMNMFRLTIFIDTGTPFNHTYSLYLFAFFSSLFLNEVWSYFFLSHRAQFHSW